MYTSSKISEIKKCQKHSFSKNSLSIVSNTKSDFKFVIYALDNPLVPTFSPLRASYVKIYLIVLLLHEVILQQLVQDVMEKNPLVSEYMTYKHPIYGVSTLQSGFNANEPSIIC